MVLDHRSVSHFSLLDKGKCVFAIKIEIAFCMFTTNLLHQNLWLLLFTHRFLSNIVDAQKEKQCDVLKHVFKYQVEYKGSNGAIVVYGCYTSFPLISAIHSAACSKSAYTTLSMINA